MRTTGTPNGATVGSTTGQGRTRSFGSGRGAGPAPVEPTGGRGNPRPVGRTFTPREGSRANQPHGRVELKQAPGSEEEQAVKVVENGEGGPKRVWEPATRRSWKALVKASAGRPSREVDSSDWERRRGDQSHGRMDATSGRRSNVDREAQPDSQQRSSRASERPRAVPRKGWETTRTSRASKHVKVHVERRKDEGGVGKPPDRLRRTVIR
jgi:hypothetical protein